MRYVIRMPAIQKNNADLLGRPVGRPSNHVRRVHASFNIRPRNTTRSPRSNGIPANRVPVPASRSLTWAFPPNRSSPATTRKARPKHNP